MFSSSLTFPKIPSTFSTGGRAASPATEVRLHETFFHEEEEERFFCLVCEAGAMGMKIGGWICGSWKRLGTEELARTRNIAMITA